MQQSFIMSFDQLCWVILFIVLAMIIPVFLMKMNSRMDTSVNVH
jgi:hypothetical protein